MIISTINHDFSICKIPNLNDVDYSDDFCFLSKTDEEISLVCPTQSTPKNVIECDSGWKAFRIVGILEFSLIGILSKITTLLADNNIGIFAISTYNTDYILTKAENFVPALSILKNNGYEIE